MSNAKKSKTVQEAITTKSKAQINFERSVENIKEKRSSGNVKLDNLGSKILYGIHEGRLTFKETDNGFAGELNTVAVSLTKVPHGTKSTRIVLGVAGMEIGGEFAARAYKMAHASLNKKGRKAINVDESKVEDVMSLLG
tara:strand:- start:389 stop:805 length:417 start_codon:yes stop_codon:yes gene_type:complete